MVPEGLQYASIPSLVSKIKGIGMNAIRLTWAVEMVDDILSQGHDVDIKTSFINVLGVSNGTKVYNAVMKNNPTFAPNISRLEVFDAIAAECAKQQVYVHLDNHVSKAGWCCDKNDGNGWFGNKFFDVTKWERALGYMANHGKSWPALRSMSLRNELRSTGSWVFNGEYVNWSNWYGNMTAGASAIHTANPDVLIFFSGLSYDSQLRPIFSNDGLGQNIDFDTSKFAYADKVILEVHDYDMDSNCTTKRGLLTENSFGALNATNPGVQKVFPLVMSEWGFEQSVAQYQGPYASCLRAFLPEQKGVPDMDEPWGLLDHEWKDWKCPECITKGLQPMIAATLDGTSSFQVSMHVKLVNDPSKEMCKCKRSRDAILGQSFLSQSSWPLVASNFVTMKSWSKAVRAKLGGSKKQAIAPVITSETNGPEQLDTLSETALQPHTNTGSALLTRLPAEVRLQIWEEVLGGNLFHLTGTTGPVKLQCFLCRNFSKDHDSCNLTITKNTRRHYHRCQGSQQEPCFFKCPEKPSYQPLSLLLTCRQIYREAVEVLYVANTFNIGDRETINAFASVTGAQSAKVQTVHVNIAMWRIHCELVWEQSGHAFDTWKSFWSDLGNTFKCLQHLRLDIFGSSIPPTRDLSQNDLQPLLVLHPLKSRSCRVEAYQKQSGQTIINNPRPLARDRERLSRPSRPTATQSCALLTGVPAEIRLRIWSYLLANNTFLIELLPGRLGSRLCYDCDTMDWQCWELGRGGDVASTSIVPFLHTCQQIYNEAIDLLYKTNTFEISDLSCLKYFVEGVPSQHLAMIPDLHVHWQVYVSRVPNSTSNWHGTWEMYWRIVFADLKGLREIALHLSNQNAMPPVSETFDLLTTRKDISGWTFWIERDHGVHSVIRGRKAPDAITA
ncbi:MAG: hypothetical protein Q9218_004190 [Villophora microphyllina]